MIAIAAIKKVARKSSHFAKFTPTPRLLHAEYRISGDYIHHPRCQRRPLEDKAKQQPRISRVHFNLSQAALKEHFRGRATSLIRFPIVMHRAANNKTRQT